MLEVIFVSVILGFWLTLPSYAANPMAVLFGGGKPVDMGKNARDGKRLLGDGKTWRGWAGGTISGTTLGLIIIGLASVVGASQAWTFGQFPQSLFRVALLAFGAMLGDMLGSYFKRRMGRERGAKTPILDQYDFLLGSWLLICIFDMGWFLDSFVHGQGWISFLSVIVITPLLHRGVNVLGFRMGHKDVPW